MPLLCLQLRVHISNHHQHATMSSTASVHHLSRWVVWKVPSLSKILINRRKQVKKHPLVKIHQHWQADESTWLWHTAQMCFPYDKLRLRWSRKWGSLFFQFFQSRNTLLPGEGSLWHVSIPWFQMPLAKFPVSMTRTTVPSSSLSPMPRAQALH